MVYSHSGHLVDTHCTALTPVSSRSTTGGTLEAFHTRLPSTAPSEAQKALWWVSCERSRAASPCVTASCALSWALAFPLSRCSCSCWACKSCTWRRSSTTSSFFSAITAQRSSHVINGLSTVIHQKFNPKHL